MTNLSPFPEPGSAADPEPRRGEVALEALTIEPLPSLTDWDRSGLSLRLASLAVAAAAHTAILVALCQTPANNAVGGGGELLDAISVEVVSSDVLESRANLPAPTASAAAVAASTGAGTQPHEAVPQQEPEPIASSPEPTVVAEAEDALAPAPTAKTSTEEIREAVETPREPESPPEPKKQPAAEAATASQSGDTGPSQAGAEARGTVAQNGQSGAASASPGEVHEYARKVVAALAEAKPTSAGRRGTVHISFTINLSGALDQARIARSSGARQLDEAALEAIQRAQFPVPPEGMTTTQLTYEVPYHFR